MANTITIATKYPLRIIADNVKNKVRFTQEWENELGKHKEVVEVEKEALSTIIEMLQLVERTMK